MSSIFVYIFIFLNFLHFGISARNREFGDLCFVTIVSCHGEHAPECTYPKDPYKDPSCWPNGLGQLTKMGKHQQFNMGKWLRQNYEDFLPCKYNRSDVHVVSEDSDVSLMSGYCCTAGMYKTQSGDMDGFPFVPVPVHNIPKETDNLLSGCKPCPAYNTLYQEALKSGEVCLADDYYDEVFYNLSRKSGLKINTVKDCEQVYHIFNSQHIHGFKLPDWAHAFYPKPLKEIAEFSYKLPCSTIPLKRLKCGPLLKDILGRMESKTLGEIPQKMWIYVSNDKTLVNLMQCLNVYDGCIPPQSSMVIFELYRADSDHYVTVSFKSPGNFKTLRSPTCGRICSLQVFKTSLKTVIPVDWDSECNKVTKSDAPS